MGVGARAPTAPWFRTQSSRSDGGARGAEADAFSRFAGALLDTAGSRSIAAKTEDL